MASIKKLKIKDKKDQINHIKNENHQEFNNTKKHNIHKTYMK